MGGDELEGFAVVFVRYDFPFAEEGGGGEVDACGGGERGERNRGGQGGGRGCLQRFGQ